MLEQKHCPQLEDLVALAEGLIHGDERVSMLVHLEGCQLCYPLFSEALQALEDDQEELSPTGGTQEQKLIEFPRRRSLSLLVTVASMAAILLLFWGLSLVRKAEPTDYRQTYQVAMVSLAQNDGRRVMQFQFPTDPSPEILQDRRVTRGPFEWNILETDPLHKAIDLIKEQANADSANPQPWLDLASLNIASGNFQEAYLNVARAMTLDPENPETRCLVFTCRFLLGGQKKNPDTQHDAILEMQALMGQHPDSAMIAYNLCHMLATRGRSPEMEAAAQHFLSLSDTGPRSDQIRLLLQE